jgi:hypothetical protein
MKTLTVYFLTLSSIVFSQAKFEIQEFTGTVTNIRPGWGFALEIIELKTGNEIRYFRIDPVYGKSILSKIKIGQTLTLKAKVNLTVRENYLKGNKQSTEWGFRFSEQVDEIQLQGQWVQTPMSPQKKSAAASYYSDCIIVLEEKILDDFHLDGLRKGLIFKDGIIAFALYAGPRINSMEAFLPGQKVSFMGFKSSMYDEYLFPIEGIKSVSSFIHLTRLEGKIESHIYKQNFARIGMVVNGKRLSYPSEKAQTIERFANNEKVIVYYNGFEDPQTNLLPTIHAIIQGGDTLYIPGLYYGGPDGMHDHKTVEVDGTISKINRTAKGRILSLITNNGYYVEVTVQTAEQLGGILQKGTRLKIHGEERIKKEGEIYEKDYRIITPKRIVIEGKEFILNN